MKAEDFTAVKKLALLLLVPAVMSCGEDPTPKPMGYMRISLPEKSYSAHDFHCPFKFEIPAYSRVEKNKPGSEHPCWFNIAFPRFDARVYFTYKEIDGNLRELLEESHTLVSEHQIKARAIDASSVKRDSARVYGTFYELKGNVASPVQLYLTDSTSHYLRGSLYFRARPNADSLAPVQHFITEDLRHFVQSFEWK